MCKRLRGKYVWLICTMLILAVVSAACAAPGKLQQKTALLNDITVEGKFQYKDYPWFISESDFFAKSKMDEKTSLLSQQEKFKNYSDKKTQAYSEPNISMFPVFFFSDGKLYQVQLDVSFPDEKTFSAAAKELKAVFDKNLDKPTIGDTEFLNKIPPETGAGLGGLYWTGNDKSSVAIGTFGYSETTPGYSSSDNSRYVISMQINAPVEHTNR